MLPGNALILTLGGPQFVADLDGPTLVYTWDGDRVTVGTVEAQAGRKAVPHVVELDDGSIVVADHETLVLKRSGSPAYISDLQPDDSLLPLYMKLDSPGYLTYRQPGDWQKGAKTARDSYRWRRVSRMVAEWKLGRRCQPGDVVSFKDGIRTNCHPDNLKIEHKKPRKPKKISKFAEPIFVADRFIKKHNHRVVQVRLDISRDLFSIRGLEASNLSVGGIFISVDTTE
jgi:hypothetical protein